MSRGYLFEKNTQEKTQKYPNENNRKNWWKETKLASKQTTNNNKNTERMDNKKKKAKANRHMVQCVHVLLRDKNGLEMKSNTENHWKWKR